jgi:acetylornithine deacetylase/succinyl-diaminopimelate desuccinylase-like protein
MSILVQLKAWIQKNREEIQKDYFAFLRFKSISADPHFSKELIRCSEWLKNYIKKHTTLDSELIHTEGYPLVYAEDVKTKGAPTLLIYGHYDVQPVDPLELWDSDPFKPKMEEDRIYARGAVDDKGQIFYAIAALRAWKELRHKIPLNLKLCIEGEEESSSKGLSKALPHLKEKLKADSLLVIDFDQFDQETPAISLGARGVIALEVSVTGSKSDLHSGVHGGMAYNPNKALVEMLASIWDKNGRVQIDGFYDDVIEPSVEDKKQFSFRHDLISYAKEFGIDAIGGEKGRSLAENNTFRPTLEINGISGGYTGVGFKTVIPAQAIAKLSCRLVPNQNPQRIARLISDFLKKKAPFGMKVNVTFLGGEGAFRSSLHSSLAKAVSKAAEEVTGKECKNMLCGGSIPIVASMMQTLKLDVVGMGYGLATDNIHAPNEHFDWSRFEKGFLTVGRMLELL